MAKDSHILSTKNNSVFVIIMFEILTNHYLKMSLIFNNWALVSWYFMSLYQFLDFQVVTLLL